MPLLYFRVPSTTLMCSIPHIMASADSSKASFSVQQEHVEESGGGCGESQEEVGDSEEGVEGTEAVEVTGGGEGGGGGGGWQGGNGLSLGVKSREFPRQLNHSTRQAKGFVSADKSGVLSRMGGTKVKVGVGATIKVVVEANSVTGGEPCPLFSSILGRAPLRLSRESRHRDIDLKPHEERVRRVSGCSTQGQVEEGHNETEFFSSYL